MGQSACVKPLGKVFKVCGIAFREGEGGGDGFAEGVVRVEGSGEEGRYCAEGFEVEVEGGIGTTDREGDWRLEKMSVLLQCAIEVGTRKPYLVGVDGVGSMKVLGMVVVISFVLIICFFFVGIVSSVVVLGIVGATFVASRSK